MKDFARSVKLTNDVAERGVKLIDDYTDMNMMIMAITQLITLR